MLILILIIFLISIIFLMIQLFLTYQRYIRLSNENLKLHMENMAIHELYLKNKSCQSQKTGSQVSVGVGAESIIRTPEETDNASNS